MTIEPRLTAGEAAREIGPSVQEATLKRAMAAGRLRYEQLGKRRYTTVPWVQEWLRSCRENVSLPASNVERSAASASGSSATGRDTSVQDALKQIGGELTRRFPDTSLKRSAPPKAPDRRAS